MYLLQFLEKASSRATVAVSADAAEPVDIEYRLACSGELYRRTVQTLDWRKSDIARVLLRTPLELFVNSQPFHSYPQELCVRMSLSYVTEKVAGKPTDPNDFGGSTTFLPDEDVIEDLCSILSLLSRRLISPVAKTRERRSSDRYGSHAEPYGSCALDFPVPIMPPSPVAVWNRRPLSIVTTLDRQRVIDNSPPPTGVDQEALAEFLLKLPAISRAIDIVYASRLYRASLELIESRPDIAYQLLISTVECFADIAFGNYEPEDSERISTKVTVQKRAFDFGLDEEQAKRLALDACEGQRWLKRKFKKFLLDYTPLDELSSEDRVFHLHEKLCPSKETIPQALGKVYDMRSGNLHGAVPFPSYVRIGTSTKIDIRDALQMFSHQLEIPPVPWFERIVSLASRRFLLEKSSIKSAPFADVT